MIAAEQIIMAGEWVDIEANILAMYEDHSLSDIAKAIGVNKKIVCKEARRLEQKGKLVLRDGSERLQKVWDERRAALKPGEVLTLSPRHIYSRHPKAVSARERRRYMQQRAEE
jgi:predicted regulator of amino acid metabolism with ACT domain